MPSVPGRYKILINASIHSGHYLPFHYISSLLLVLNMGNLQLYKSNRHIIKINFKINFNLQAKSMGAAKSKII